MYRLMINVIFVDNIRGVSTLSIYVLITNAILISSYLEKTDDTSFSLMTSSALDSPSCSLSAKY